MNILETQKQHFTLNKHTLHFVYTQGRLCIIMFMKVVCHFFFLSWLCFCNTNMVSLSSFNSTTKLMKEPSGSHFIAFKVQRCCCRMEPMQASSVTVFERGGLHDLANRSPVDQLWSIVAGQQTIHCFRVVFSRA